MRSRAARISRSSNTTLLARLGTYAQRQFAERIAALDLSPVQTGLLRAISATPGQSQQVLANALETPPTRLVALVDGLEQRGLIERKRNPDDRRLYALYLTGKGRELLRRITAVGTAHENAILAALNKTERAQLRDLLDRIAIDQGLAVQDSLGN